MQRPVWSGDLSFGIVTIPVRLHPAVRDHDIHFHQISRTTHRRIHYRKVVEGSDKEVPAGDIAKGYELKPGGYVLFEDSELARLAMRKNSRIEISAFVRIADIDPRYYDRPYFLLPAKPDRKPYRLLVEAMAAAGRAGIAQMIMHQKEHLVIIRSLHGTLCLETMHFDDELVDPAELQESGAAGKVSERELAMAGQLIESMSSSFKPEQYRDEYRQRLLAAIKRKGRGKPFQLDEPEPEEDGDHGKVIDLMDALKRSLAKRGAPATRHDAKRRRKPA